MSIKRMKNVVCAGVLVGMVFLMSACNAERVMNALDHAARIGNIVADQVEIGFKIAADIAYIKSLQNADQQRLGAAYKNGVATSWVTESGEVIAFTPGYKYSPNREYPAAFKPYYGKECMKSQIITKKSMPDGSIVNKIVDADACYDAKSNQWAMVRGSEREEVMEAYAAPTTTLKKKKTKKQKRIEEDEY